MTFRAGSGTLAKDRTTGSNRLKPLGQALDRMINEAHNEQTKLMDRPRNGETSRMTALPVHALQRGSQAPIAGHKGNESRIRGPSYEEFWIPRDIPCMRQQTFILVGLHKKNTRAR